MFLANENFPRPGVILLRDKGFKVKSVQEELPGISDEMVMNIASQMNLIILTFDRDYGEIIFKHKRNNPRSYLFQRERKSDPLFAGNLLLTLLSDAKMKLNNSFTVIEVNNIRQRFYRKE